MAALPEAAMLQLLINLNMLAQRADAEAREAREARQAAQAQAQARVRRRRRPRWWVRPWSTQQRRLSFGHWDNLLRELRAEDAESYFNYLRMTPELFEEILHRIEPAISRQNTRWRESIPAGLKLAVTLRHLASGELYPTLQFQFRISKKTITKFVPQVCQAIHQEFVDEVMDLPQDSDGWKAVAAEFQRKWNVPHAIGALDGKHVRIKKPVHSGSLYHNYKGFFSVVLMALVDADYKFLYTDVGGQGHMSDCQIFNASELKDALDAGDLHLPDPDPMPNDDQDTPYFILGDDAFALRVHLMKPFSQRALTRDLRIYNYRISRGRRVVENAFGILARRFQCFLGTLQQTPQVVIQMVHAAICLHNLMRLRMPAALRDRHLDREDDDHQLIPGAWRQDANMIPMDARHQGVRDLEVAKRQRQTLVAYFNSPAGEVPWQARIVDA